MIEIKKTNWSKGDVKEKLSVLSVTWMRDFQFGECDASFSFLSGLNLLFCNTKCIS